MKVLKTEEVAMKKRLASHSKRSAGREVRRLGTVQFLQGAGVGILGEAVRVVTESAHVICIARTAPFQIECLRKQTRRAS
jgi:hypothetical protein